MGRSALSPGLGLFDGDRLRGSDARPEVEPVRDGEAELIAARCRACSSAMRLSIAPLRRW
jgi:hypothetical protein